MSDDLTLVQLVRYECGCAVDPARAGGLRGDLPFAVELCEKAKQIAQSLPMIMVDCYETDQWWAHFKYGKICAENDVEVRNEQAS